MKRPKFWGAFRLPGKAGKPSRLKEGGNTSSEGKSLFPRVGTV